MGLGGPGVSRRVILCSPLSIPSFCLLGSVCEFRSLVLVETNMRISHEQSSTPVTFEAVARKTKNPCDCQKATSRSKSCFGKPDQGKGCLMGTLAHPGRCVPPVSIGGFVSRCWRCLWFLPLAEILSYISWCDVYTVGDYAGFEQLLSIP